jgi:hypothetical protein
MHDLASLIGAEHYREPQMRRNLPNQLIARSKVRYQAPMSFFRRSGSDSACDNWTSNVALTFSSATVRGKEEHRLELTRAWHLLYHLGTNSLGWDLVAGLSMNCQALTTTSSSSFGLLLARMPSSSSSKQSVLVLVSVSFDEPDCPVSEAHPFLDISGKI